MRKRIGIAKLLFFGSLLSIIGIIIAFLFVFGAGYSAARGVNIPVETTVELANIILALAVLCCFVFGVSVTVNTVYVILTFATKGDGLSFYEKGGAAFALVFLYVMFYALSTGMFFYVIKELLFL